MEQNKLTCDVAFESDNAEPWKLLDAAIMNHVRLSGITLPGQDIDHELHASNIHQVLWTLGVIEKVRITKGSNRGWHIRITRYGDVLRAGTLTLEVLRTSAYENPGVSHPTDSPYVLAISTFSGTHVVFIITDLFCSPLQSRRSPFEDILQYDIQCWHQQYL
jgi:hypothetical protein